MSKDFLNKTLLEKLMIVEELDVDAEKKYRAHLFVSILQYVEDTLSKYRHEGGEKNIDLTFYNYLVSQISDEITRQTTQGND